MRGTDLKEGMYCRLNAKFHANHYQSNNGSQAIDLKPGDIVKCIERKRINSGCYNQNWVSAVDPSGNATEKRYKVYNHQGLTPLSENEMFFGEPREQEQKQLNQQIRMLRSAIEDYESKIVKSKQLLNKASNRLECVTTYESDEDALHHIILTAREQNLSRQELKSMIAKSGISIGPTG
jgi:hypothetical protein